MGNLNLGRDLYLKGRIGWQGLSKDEYLNKSGYKIINATALMDGYINWDNCGYISKERYDEAKEIQLQEDDILISKDGTIGKVGYVKNLSMPCSVASGIFVLRNTAKDKVDFEYLYHLLKSQIFKDFIRRNKALGSTIAHLYQRDLENFDLELPCIENQKKISCLLSAIDSKIELNKKISTLLEEQAKTLYDYWFTQFDFPDENGKPYKSSGGKMVWNEELKREIPEGWKVGNLYEIAYFTNGLACQRFRPEKGDKGLNVIKIKEMHTGITPDTELVSSAIPNKYVINTGDILFSWSATLEVMYWHGEKAGLNQHIFKVEPKNGLPTEYVYQQLSNYVVNFVAMADSRKTTMGHITSDHINQSRIPIAPKHLAEKFSSQVNSLRNLVFNASKENSALASLRDFLLPLLMNGQCSIKCDSLN